MTLIAPIASVGFVAAFEDGGATSYATRAGSPHSITATDNAEAAFNASTTSSALLRKTHSPLVMSLALAPVAPILSGIIVDTTVDEDDTNPANCSLREAIVAANNDAAFGGCTAGSGEDTITFDIPGAGPHIIQLTTWLDDLETDMNIQGPTDESVQVRGEGIDDPIVFSRSPGRWSAFLI